MIKLLKARIAHGYQAIPNPLQAQVHERFPCMPQIAEDAELVSIALLCPAQAISEKGIDLGRCVFCGICERAYPQQIRFLPDFRMAADTREKLVIAPGQKDMPTINAPLKSLIRRSIALRNVSAGGCNACELELGASNNVNFDIGRYGIEIEASPRHADALILTGPLSKNMADAMRISWQAIPSPKLLILCGACAISGGIFRHSAALDRSFLEHWEAQLFIPGCPTHPLSIVHAIHSLMGAK